MNGNTARVVFVVAVSLERHSRRQSLSGHRLRLRTSGNTPLVGAHVRIDEFEPTDHQRRRSMVSYPVDQRARPVGPDHRRIRSPRAVHPETAVVELTGSRSSRISTSPLRARAVIPPPADARPHPACRRNVIRHGESRGDCRHGRSCQRIGRPSSARREARECDWRLALLLRRGPHSIRLQSAALCRRWFAGRQHGCVRRAALWPADSTMEVRSAISTSRRWLPFGFLSPSEAGALFGGRVANES